MVARGWERERNGMLFNGVRVSVLQNGKSSEDRLENSVGVLLDHPFKNGEDGKK